MNEYTIWINGLPHTVLLSDEQARGYGLVPYSERPTEVKQAPAPKNKMRKPGNK